MSTSASRSNQQSSTIDETLCRVAKLLDSNQTARAIEVLRHETRTDRINNALGVCYLRSDRPEDGLKYFKDLVLSPGSIWPRADAHDTYKVNYATALLMCGHPAGAVAALSTVKDATVPGVMRLRSALNAWAAQLPFMARLLWKLGQVEPQGQKVKFDFNPGDLV